MFPTVCSPTPLSPKEEAQNAPQFGMSTIWLQKQDERGWKHVLINYVLAMCGSHHLVAPIHKYRPPTSARLNKESACARNRSGQPKYNATYNYFGSIACPGRGPVRLGLNNQQAADAGNDNTLQHCAETQSRQHYMAVPTVYVATTLDYLSSSHGA